MGLGGGVGDRPSLDRSRIEHVARPLHALRRLREWDFSQVADKVGAIDIQEFDRRAQTAMLECLRSRDPSQAEPALSGIVQLPQEAIGALKRTPVGEVARIVITVVPANLKEESSG